MAKPRRADRRERRIGRMKALMAVVDGSRTPRPPSRTGSVARDQACGGNGCVPVKLDKKLEEMVVMLEIRFEVEQVGVRDVVGRRASANWREGVRC